MIPSAERLRRGHPGARPRAREIGSEWCGRVVLNAVGDRYQSRVESYWYKVRSLDVLGTSSRNYLPSCWWEHAVGLTPTIAGHVDSSAPFEALVEAGSSELVAIQGGPMIGTTLLRRGGIRTRGSAKKSLFLGLAAGVVTRGSACRRRPFLILDRKSVV